MSTHARPSRLSRAQRRLGGGAFGTAGVVGFACLLGAPVLPRWQSSLVVVGALLLAAMIAWFVQDAADRRAEYVADRFENAVAAATRPVSLDVAALAQSVGGWAGTMVRVLEAVEHAQQPDPAPTEPTSLPLRILPTGAPTAPVARVEDPAEVDLFAEHHADPPIWTERP